LRCPRGSGHAFAACRYAGRERAQEDRSYIRTGEWPFAQGAQGKRVARQREESFTTEGTESTELKRKWPIPSSLRARGVARKAKRDSFRKKREKGKRSFRKRRGKRREILRCAQNDALIFARGQDARVEIPSRLGACHRGLLALQVQRQKRRSEDRPLHEEGCARRSRTTLGEW